VEGGGGAIEPDLRAGTADLYGLNAEQKKKDVHMVGGHLKTEENMTHFGSAIAPRKKLFLTKTLFRTVESLGEHF